MPVVPFIKELLSKKRVSKNYTEQPEKLEETSITNSQQTSSKEGTNFEYKDGVRYQNEDDVPYLLPNDYQELDRLHQQHWLFRFLLQRNFHAPIKEDLERGIKVLDSGCGPGTWTFDMAEVYKLSKFCGIDSSFIFPEKIKPANVDFVIANLTKTLPFPDNHFDYIYQRLLILGLKSDDWNNALHELYRILKPGGYIELVECDTELKNVGPLTKKLHDSLMAMASAANMLPDIAKQLNNRLIESGFINVQLKKQETNYNHTGKGGQLLWEDYTSLLSNSRSALARFNPEYEDVQFFEKLLDDCGKECKELKTYGCTIHVYVAQKPY